MIFKTYLYRDGSTFVFASAPLNFDSTFSKSASSDLTRNLIFDARFCLATPHPAVQLVESWFQFCPVLGVKALGWDFSQSLFQTSDFCTRDCNHPHGQA